MDKKQKATKMLINDDYNSPSPEIIDVIPPRQKTKTKNAPKSASVPTKKASKSAPKSAPVQAKKAPISPYKNLNILFTTSECAPFCKTGGLGDVSSALPEALSKFPNNKVAVMLPKYSLISKEYKSKMKFLGSKNINFGWRNQYCNLYSLKMPKSKVAYYFLENDYYFTGDNVYGDYDWERFIFFSRACLEMIELLPFTPNILHANDWQTGIIPAFYDCYYRTKYPNIKTVFTIHNLKYQGVHGIDFINDIAGLPWEYYENDRIGKHGTANLMKAGIVYANKVTTVSPTYSAEICTPEGGCGLDWAINARKNDLIGIVNGVDYAKYSPQSSDVFQYTCYDDFNSGKLQNKQILREVLHLPNSNVPIIGMVTRLTEQKGLDLIGQSIGEILRRDIQLIILGTGDEHYENMLKHYAYHNPDKFSLNLTFSEQLATKIYAGADMFLMPSQFEPCGISQLISLSFGTLPIVRETGGLKDTVLSYNEEIGEGNGFSFAPYAAHDMLYTIDRALHFYYDEPAIWQKITQNAMRQDWSWAKSATQYIEEVYDGRN